tara:strand:+ start:25 stop:267 length:243 start_codon:yes stop_codon:yes gene_type:complete
MSKILGMDGTNKPPNAHVNVKPEDLKDIVCENCGGKYFRQVHAFKRVSALLSSTGKEQIVPVPTFRCDDCGHINAEFQLK